MAALLVDVLIVALVAAIVYWILTLIPMDARLRNIILAVLLLLILVWLLSVFGVFGTHRHVLGGL